MKHEAEIRRRRTDEQLTSRHILPDGGSIFFCDDCGDETPESDRREYLPPESELDSGSVDDLETRPLCPRCSVQKPSVRLFRPKSALEEEGDE